MCPFVGLVIEYIVNRIYFRHLLSGDVRDFVQLSPVLVVNLMNSPSHGISLLNLLSHLTR